MLKRNSIIPDRLVRGEVFMVPDKVPQTTSQANEYPERTGERIAEVLAKIQLIEVDRRAFAEASHFSFKNNAAKIANLKKENKELNKKYVGSITCDEHTMNTVFPGHEISKWQFVNKTPLEAIDELLMIRGDMTNKLNLAIYETKKKGKELNEMDVRMKNINEFADRMNRLDNDPKSQKFKNRAIRTDIEKYTMKNTEADEVRKYFGRIDLVLSEENKLYDAHLEFLDKQIEDNLEELRGLQEMHRDAEAAKEAAKMDMHLQNEAIDDDKKQREKAKGDTQLLNDMRHDEFDNINRMVAEKQNQLPEDDDFDGVSQKERQANADDAEKKISQLEQDGQKIRESTGLKNSADAIDYFKNQNANKDSFDDQNNRNSRRISDLEDQKKRLQGNYDDLQYEGTEGDESYDGDSASLVGTEADDKFDPYDARISQTNDKLNNNRRATDSLKGAVDHLNEKLSRLSGPRRRPSDYESNRADYIADSLDNTASRIKSLSDETGKDTDRDQVMKEMDDSRFNDKVGDRMTPANNRVSRRRPSKDESFEDENETDDEQDIPKRSDVKRASESLMDSKHNRRGQRKPRRF